jgi:hypothetical protein
MTELTVRRRLSRKTTNNSILFERNEHDSGTPAELANKSPLLLQRGRCVLLKHRLQTFRSKFMQEGQHTIRI